MPNTDAPLAPDPLQPPDRPGRRRHLWRRVTARRGTDENDSAFGFGVRLFAAIALTLALVCAVGYVLIDRQLEHRQIENDAAAQRADARGFEYESAHASSPARAIGQIDGLLDAIQRRPGTLEALLIDRRHVIRASGEDRLIGAEDNDARIEAALRDGRSYAGREGDPRKDRANFEFVTPVELAGERYAYELSYSHRAYDAQLHDIRLVLGLVGLIALFGGGAVFYLIGGRTLLRDHRLALARATRDGLTDLPNQRAFQDELPRLWPPPGATCNRSRSRYSMSTTSSSSTTATDILTATPCSGAWPRCCASPGRATARSGSAATSSPCCWRRPTPRERACSRAG